uniref:CRISPR system Cms protein Csm5 n=1 Tax=Caldimicrobium thiodismutans TaxID=1653476 RepID=A0A832GLX5_9BACT
MNSPFKTYHVRLTTLTPLHIGTGETFDFTQVTIDIQNNLLYAFNLIDLVNNLSPTEREELERIADTPSAEALVKLQKFYCYRILPKIIQISRNCYKIPSELTQAFERTLKLTRERDIYQQFNSIAIRSHFKDTFTGDPLIPGSSLKGALRTGYLEGLYKETSKISPEKVKHIKGLVDQISNEGSYKSLKERAFKELENTLLKNGEEDIKLDPFKNLKVSDLSPKAKVAKEIVFALNLRKQNSSSIGSLSVPIEILPPGSVFEGQIKLVTPHDHDIVSPIKLEELIKFNSSHYKAILREEVALLTHLKKLLGERLRPHKEALDQKKALLLKLGHHSGASAVTIEGLRKILVKTTGGRKIIKDSATTFWVATLNKRDISQAEPFGWVVLEFLDL